MSTSLIWNAKVASRNSREESGLAGSQPSPPAQSCFVFRIAFSINAVLIVLEDLLRMNYQDENISLSGLANSLSCRLSPRSWTSVMICLTVFCIYADQNILAPNLSAIAEDFGFSDKERDQKLGGYIAVGFFIVGGPAALLIGYLADFCNRTVLFGLVVILGESSTLGAYWVQTYSQLLACRVLTGISIGGATPIIFSLLGDMYSGSQRIYMSTVVGLSLSAGIAGGQLVAGLVGPWLGWRAPFLLVAVPSLICACTILLTVEEPRRGDQEKAVRSLRSATIKQQQQVTTVTHNPLMREETVQVAVVSNLSTLEAHLTHPDNADPQPSPSPPNDVAYTEQIECRKVGVMCSTLSVLIIFLQGFPGCLPWGVIVVFLNDYFSSDRGMSVQAATAVVTTFSLGGLGGQVFGGWLGQRLYNLDARYQCVLMGVSTLLSVLPLLYLLNSSRVGDLGFYFMALLGGFIVNINGPNVRVVLQNVCVPEVRGTAFAFFTLCDDLGKGLGPALVVVLIDAMGGSRR
ncbi:MFS transporter [archaeon]|nr:MAG: MFS transporter [archaeon]